MSSRLFPACLLSSSMHTRGLGSPLSVLDADKIRPCPGIWTTSRGLEAMLLASCPPPTSWVPLQGSVSVLAFHREAGAQQQAILRKHSSKAHFLPPSLEHIPTYWPHSLTELSATANTGLSPWPAACPILRDAVGLTDTTHRKKSWWVSDCGLLRPWPNVSPGRCSLRESLKEYSLGLFSPCSLLKADSSLSLPSLASSMHFF